MLAEWSPKTSRADIVVAADGTGDHRTINEAVAALTHGANGRNRRVVVHVKAGIYNEKVEIGRNLKNLMFVGDGIGRTIITADRNVHDGATTRSSATFGTVLILGEMMKGCPSIVLIMVLAICRCVRRRLLGQRHHI